MAVFIIIAGTIAVFAIGAGWYLGMAIIIELLGIDQWNHATPEALFARDTTLTMIYFFPVVMFGWIAIWGILRASKSNVNFG